MRKPKSISAETRGAILQAAWDLIAEQGRTDVAMTEVAARAGVSRQAVFYAYGGRPGLLLAMVRHKDTLTDHVARLGAMLTLPEPGPEDLVTFADIWLDYLPEIYPVGILLDAASAGDPEAAAAWDDRMKGALLGGLKRLAAAVHAGAPMPADPARLAEAIWAQVHPTTWRRLVVECGWSTEDFRAHQLGLIRQLIGLGAVASAPPDQVEGSQHR